ncbi:hypothetical protein I4U23_015520 [Adineta vaga]|nr:hypothetical protein I4U23_015520 [Adineta vaga]
MSSSINFAFINQSINRYATIPLLFLGTIGNILNIFVFTRKIFRKNICVIYFLASTISDSFSIGIGLLTRFLYGYSIDPAQFSSIFCKLRFFITYLSAFTGAWFVSLACIERYFCSSTNVRQRERVTTKRAYLSIIFVVILGIIAFSEQFYCIDINQQLLGAPQSCYQLKQNIACQIADSLIQFLLEIISPAVVMIVFGFLLLRNIREKRRRIHAIHVTNSPILMESLATANFPIQEQQQSIDIKPISNTQSQPVKTNRTAQKHNAQLITILLIQVVIFIISAFPVSIYKFYSVATIYDTRTSLRQSIENTIFNASVICFFLNNTIKFYIYTLCGAIFRKELIKLFRVT